MNRDNFDISQVTVIIPAYNPSEAILEVVDGVLSHGFTDIIIVNDGSKKEKLPLFDCIAKKSGDGIGIRVLNHKRNMGKGAALKTGFRYFIKNRGNQSGIVTVDDDGQHLPCDIKKCAIAMIKSGVMVLGQRDFGKAGVPKKSLIGNSIMASAFKLFTGLKLADTQTGLRAIPRAYIPKLTTLPGNRYDYETIMLAAAKHENWGIKKVKIETVYIDGNKRSNYRALTDSAIIFARMIKYLLLKQ